MSKVLYRVVTDGSIVSGYDREAVKKKFAQLLNLTDDPKRLEQLFSGRRVILKKNLDESSATAFAVKIQAHGLFCQLVEEGAIAEVASAPAVVEPVVDEPCESPAISDVAEETSSLNTIRDIDPSGSVYPKARYGVAVVIVLFVLTLAGGYWGLQNQDKLASLFSVVAQLYDETISSIFGEDELQVGDAMLAEVDVDTASPPPVEEVQPEAIAEVVKVEEPPVVVASQSKKVAEEKPKPVPPVAEKPVEPVNEPEGEVLAAPSDVAVAASDQESETARVEKILGKKKEKEEPFFPSFRDLMTSGDYGPEMVVMPAGSFTMGDLHGDGDETELPLREVSIVKPFAIGRYEVTFAEYDTFALMTGRKPPRDQLRGRGSRPVINVSWDDANAYAQWLSEQTRKRYRLPSEAEWEYVARAGTQNRYTWGDDIGVNHANCKGCGSIWDNIQLSPVGYFKENADGIFDLHGNAAEWVADCFHETYGAAPIDGSAWVEDGECRMRGLRGGSWRGTEETIRISKRRWYQHYSQNDMVGFRLVRDLVK